MFCSIRRWCGCGNDELNLKTDEFGREIRESIELPFSRSVFNHNVLIFQIAKLAQP
jgi:hypothetical protein